MPGNDPIMPSEAASEPGLFDRFANVTERAVSHAWFFVLCLLMVLLWFPTLFLMPIDSSQLIINTSTTIITFLLVALLQNTQKRGSDAQQQKLNALARALGAIAEKLGCPECVEELEEAIGLEKKEST
jgi:low affinity Fe/Cu permease